MSAPVTVKATQSSHDPHFGFTSLGHPVHVSAFDHLPNKTRINRFNSRLAVRITTIVGSMWCAYAFALLALWGLPGALRPGGTGFVPWFAQTFLQLVLLSIIIVGGKVQAIASDARAVKTFEDTEIVLDRVDEHTQGGIEAILAELHRQSAEIKQLIEEVHGKGEPL